MVWQISFWVSSHSVWPRAVCQCRIFLLGNQTKLQNWALKVHMFLCVLLILVLTQLNFGLLDLERTRRHIITVPDARRPAEFELHGFGRGPAARGHPVGGRAVQVAAGLQ
eukprot:EG_transcript_28355